MAKKSASPSGGVRKTSSISSSSTAEYFSKNLQQVGFSSQTKAVLTTLKEAVDNALDACDDAGILPAIDVSVERVGKGSLKNSDKIKITVIDNGPGINPDDISKVFGEYLASSKFGRGRCSRGQQGIGISAATTWAQLTTAKGARVITKRSNMRKAIDSVVEVDIRANKGNFREKKTIDWDRAHGTSVSFEIDGRVQLNGEAGLLNYLNATALMNPHLTLTYTLLEHEKVEIPRVSEDIPVIPHATPPHPHTMKLGEFIAHSHLFGKVKTGHWLKKAFSRVNEGTLKEIVAAGFSKKLLESFVTSLADPEIKKLFGVIQDLKLMAPSTKTVVTVGEEALAKSITRMGELDFFSVVSRKPRICDFKPVQIEVAIARLASKAESDEQVQVLRFANRVPLQFDKSACAIVRAIESVNWRSYGIAQPKKSLPVGPYIVAVSVVSPFIKFKNASKETIDASDELVDELRKALIQAGQKLSRFIKREKKEAALEEKIKHIEQFGPILVGGLVRILNTSEKRKTAAEKGLEKILGRDTMTAKDELKSAAKLLDEFQEKNLHIMQAASQTMMDAEELADEGESEQPEKAKSKKSANPKAKKATQKKSVAKTKTEPVKTKKTAVPKVKKAKVSKRKSKSKGRKR